MLSCFSWKNAALVTLIIGCFAIASHAQDEKPLPPGTGTETNEGIAVGEPYPGGDPSPDDIPLQFGIYMDDFTVIPSETSGEYHFELDAGLNSSGYELVSQDLILDGTTVYAMVEFKREAEVVLPVLTPYWLRIGTLPLKNGDYELLPVVNYERRMRTVIPFSVHDDQVKVGEPMVSLPELPSVDPPDDPAVADPIPTEPVISTIDVDGIVIHNLQVVLSPGIPSAGKEFYIIVNGEHANAGVELVDSSVRMTKSIPAQVHFDVQFKQTDDVAAEVITPFKVKIGPILFPAGDHPLTGSINGEAVSRSTIHVVGEDGENDTNGIPTEPEFNTFEVDGIVLHNLKMVLMPGLPLADEEFYIVVNGEYPNAGVELADSNVAIMESYPEQVRFDLTFEKTGDVSAEVISPFQVEIGPIQLSAGDHPFTGWINGKAAFRAVFHVVGEDGENETIGAPTDAITEYPMEARTAEATGLTVRAPFSGDFELGDVEYGDLSNVEGMDGLTDGQGMIVTLEPGEGVTVLGRPVVVDGNYVYVQVAAMTDTAGVSLGLGALDADSTSSTDTYGMNGSSNVTLINDASRIANRFGIIESVYKSERGAIVPVFQAVNTTTDQTIVVEFDNLRVLQFAALDLPPN